MPDGNVANGPCWWRGGSDRQGVPPGLGKPVFDKLDVDLAKTVMSIPAVKGVEIGVGFEAAEMLGSECNDAFIVKGKIISTRTNHAGGILGGISNGEDIVLRLVVKPTLFINKAQDTITLKGKKATITVFASESQLGNTDLKPIGSGLNKFKGTQKKYNRLVSRGLRLVGMDSPPPVEFYKSTWRFKTIP